MKKYISDLKSFEDLAALLKCNSASLYNMLNKNNISSCYRNFTIPKKLGGQRIIKAPNDELKNIQKIIADRLRQDQERIWSDLNLTRNTKISHGYVKGKSNITNSAIHKGKKTIINIDLADFFNSFHFGRVFGFFNKNRYFRLPESLCYCLANLVCCDGFLPQGAPTSPIISNLIFTIVDLKILKIASKYKLDYTRYVDDLTFSTNNKKIDKYLNVFLQDLQVLLKENGFKINENKYRVSKFYQRQEVTGIVVNKRLSVPNDFVRNTRAMAYKLYTSNTLYIDNKEATINQLEGRFNYIFKVDSSKLNTQKEVYKPNIHKLTGREEQYRKFLFYKTFYNINHPLIITEGKTDQKYIISALKKYYLEYPSLICKDDSDVFNTSFAFLKRNKTINSLMGIAHDGADALNNIYNYHSGNKKFPNYSKYFNTLSKSTLCTPIIIILDNELNVNKPLKKFINNCNLSQQHINELNKNLYLKLPKTNNVYLITLRLIEDKKEIEMEDLFKTKFIENLRIAGKSFDKECKDTNKSFGKAVLANYVNNNYKNIDFDNFKSLLNVINTIITNNAKQ